MRKRGDLFAPAIVLTARQTAGRGRGANTWFSAAGSLTVTFVLPVNPTLAPHHLPLAAGLAVRDAAAELAADENVQLKWPNDLVYGAAAKMPRSGITSPPPLKKLAGLLCERLDHVDLIGVGLNINLPTAPLPPEIADRVIFLQQLSQSQAAIDLTTALLTLKRHLHRVLVRQSETPFPALLREYDRHHALLGRTIAVYVAAEPPVVGKCEGLDSTGRLLLRTRAGLKHMIAGHVELR